MAAALIPILTAAAPLLSPLIQSIVLHVERLFGAGTGPQKLTTAVNTILGIADDLSKSGKIPGVLDPASITGLIQATVTDLKSRGILTPDLATSIISAQASTSTIPPTSTLKITGGTIQVAAG